MLCQKIFTLFYIVKGIGAALAWLASVRVPIDVDISDIGSPTTNVTVTSTSTNSGSTTQTQSQTNTATNTNNDQDSAADDPSVFAITEKASTSAFSWLTAPTRAFSSKTLL